MTRVFKISDENVAALMAAEARREVARKDFVDAVVAAQEGLDIPRDVNPELSDNMQYFIVRW